MIILFALISSYYVSANFTKALNRTYEKVFEADRHHSMLNHVQVKPCPKDLCRAVKIKTKSVKKNLIK